MKSPAKTLSQAKQEKGLTIADLMEATGLSQAGVCKCLRLNRPPHNPLIRRKFLEALGLPAGVHHA